MIASVKITKDKSGKLRVHYYGANHEEEFHSQAYADRHVERLAYHAHELFPDAEVRVVYEDSGGETDYVLDFSDPATTFAEISQHEGH